MISHSGKTINGHPVISGVGELCCTHGLPLELILSYWKDKGWTVDWVDYIKTCLDDGHNKKTIYSRIISAVGDIYGSEYVKEFEKKLNNYVTI